MTIILLFFVLICLYKIRPTGFHQGYIDRKTTIQINGIFVFLVLLSHFTGYLSDGMPYSQTYLLIRQVLGQLVVTTFLFYSGYGVMESVKRKGNNYIRGIPIKLLELILNFGLAIFLFVIVGTYMGKHFELSKILLSCIGWKSVGNSNWYLFDILLLYVISYLSFKLSKGSKKLALLMTFVLSIISIFFLMNYQQGTRWYNTFLCYFAGMLYSFMKSQIDRVVMKNWITYGLSGIVLIATFCYFYLYRSYLPFYMIHAIIFCLIINWASMLFELNNPILKWLGDHIFSIYILQRIPMMLGKHWGWHESNILLYLIFSITVTMLTAYLFDKALQAISKRIFLPLKKCTIKE